MEDCNWNKNKHNGKDCPIHSHNETEYSFIGEDNIERASNDENWDEEYESDLIETDPKKRYIKELKQQLESNKELLNEMIMLRDRKDYITLNKNIEKYKKADKNYHELLKKIKYFEGKPNKKGIVEIPLEADLFYDDEFEEWKTKNS